MQQGRVRPHDLPSGPASLNRSGMGGAMETVLGISVSQFRKETPPGVYF